MPIGSETASWFNNAQIIEHVEAALQAHAEQRRRELDKRAAGARSWAYTIIETVVVRDAEMPRDFDEDGEPYNSDGSPVLYARFNVVRRTVQFYPTETQQ